MPKALVLILPKVKKFTEVLAVHTTGNNETAIARIIKRKIKLVEIPEYNGQLVWYGIVQKRNEKWTIIQSHESWLNCIEVEHLH